MTKVSVIIPTYNERENVIKLVKIVLNELGALRCDFEILVMDDDSPDQTAEEVNKVYSENKHIRAMVRKGDKGLGPAVKDGIRISTGDVVVIIDGDFNHNPYDVKRLLEHINEYDVVTASRYIQGGKMEYSVFRHCASYVFNKISSLILNLKTTDNSSGFMAINKYVFDNLNLETTFHGFGEFHIRFNYYLKKKNYSVLEVPVIYKSREYGISKFKPLRFLIVYTLIVFQIRFGFYKWKK